MIITQEQRFLFSNPQIFPQFLKIFSVFRPQSMLTDFRDFLLKIYALSPNTGK